MIKKIGLSIIISLLVVVIPTAYGHGLGGETLPPFKLEGRDISLSINISPTLFESKDLERYITINLSESKSQAIVEHVTLELELSKNGKQIFKDTFHDDLGNLIIKTISNDSDHIQILGYKSPLLGAWMRTPSVPVIISGPVFNSGGLYEYKIKIIAIDSDSNIFDQKVDLKGAVSLAEQNTYDVLDSEQKSQKITLISYFDTIDSFNFDSDKVYFSMPFDWNQNFDQLSVVHQEIRIPEKFSEFLHTKYEAKINGITLQDDSVTIDDYSNEGRTIHIIANKEALNQIKEQAMQMSDSEMIFELGPSGNSSLPLEAVTPDLRYRIFLSWNPETIRVGQDVSFFVKIEEIFADKAQKNIEYQVQLSKNGSPIYNQHISGAANSQNPNQFDFKFLSDQIGTMRFDISDIEGNSLSKANFLIIVKPEEISKFPVKLESMSQNNSENGTFLVDLTWFPNSLGLGESEFIMTFYNKETGLPVKDTSYDFVLLKDDKEIHRKSGFASAGGTFENFVFVEEETGSIKLRIEKIKGTDEYVEIPINVAPEFPVGVFLVFVILIISTISFSKTKFFYRHT